MKKTRLIKKTCFEKNYLMVTLISAEFQTFDLDKRVHFIHNKVIYLCHKINARKKNK